VITIKTPAEVSGVFVDGSRITEPIAFALHAFALFVDEVEDERTTTVPLSADMEPVKSAVRLTPDAMPVGSACAVDRLVAIMITLKFGGNAVEVSA
jgi:hypothetical protein